MSTESEAAPARQVLNGATMGTRWSAILAGPAARDLTEADLAGLRHLLQAAVDRVDGQMSTWKPGSDLMRLNRAAVGSWQTVPAELFRVLQAGLRIGRLSEGLFHIGVGDLVTAWGFVAAGRQPDTGRITAQLGHRLKPAHELVEIDPGNLRVRRHAPMALDLSGIAKGFAADEMMRVLAGRGIADALVSLDGELVARGRRPDGTAWTVAVERPEHDRRAPLGMIALQDGAVATSGDYRHWVEIGRARLSHTMDPRLGGPTKSRLASVSVVNPSCMEADGWATALLVAGEDAGPALARAQGLDALFLLREGADIRQHRVGRVFYGPQPLIGAGAPAGA